MNSDNYLERNRELEKANRILQKKLQRCEKEREQLETDIAGKEFLLKQVISELENSQSVLASRSEELETTLRNLQAMQAKMLQSEKMSALGQIVAGVAHEINNPVNFIHANIMHVEDYTHDLLDFLHLNETHYPNPVEGIKEQAEKLEIDYIKEEELQKDLSLLTELEETLRCENNPRLKIKWQNEINEIKQRIKNRNGGINLQNKNLNKIELNNTKVDRLESIPIISKTSDINAKLIFIIQTPLGFFSLVVFIVEVIFAILAYLSSGKESTYLIFGMLGIIFLLLLIVTVIVIFHPISLYGKTASKEFTEALLKLEKSGSETHIVNNPKILVAKGIGLDYSEQEIITGTTVIQKAFQKSHIS